MEVVPNIAVTEEDFSRYKSMGILDIYTQKASEVYNIPPENVTIEQRWAVKTASYQNLYQNNTSL